MKITEIKKGDRLTLDFTDTTILGAGVAKHGGAVIFADGAVSGDTAEVAVTETKKNYYHAEVASLVTPSCHRISPDCPVYGSCGGCSFRHISYEYEAELKRRAVEGALRRSGITGVPVDRIITGASDRYRNKAVLHYADGKPGYYAEATHNTVMPEDSDCKLHPEYFKDVIGFTDAFFAAAGSKPAYLYIRSSEATGTFVVTVGGSALSVSDAKAYAEEARAKFPALTGVFCSESDSADSGDMRCISGEAYLTDVFLGLDMRVSPAAFYQVNHDVAERLVATACELADLKSGETAVDLYCGTGVFGLSLAKSAPGARVIGVEINEAAVENARECARRGGIDNIKFYFGDSADFAEHIGGSVDCAVIDPPRKGCSPKAIGELVRMAPKRIVYVSCNPATLARDLVKLTEAGYGIKEITAADLFPRTGHCESVCLLVRQS